MKARDAIATATRDLAPVSDTPRLDAELLMAHALSVTREALLLHHLDRPLDVALRTTFANFQTRRLGHEPVAYITGSRAFWTIELAVGPGVLIPRPDSETLIEAAVDHFHGTPGPATILDLGTGPGTLLLAAVAEWPQAHGLGIDISDRALDYAATNADDLGVDGRVRFERGDWFAGRQGRFDLILCNPPYIGTGEPLPPDVSDHEPAGALYAGADGLAAYRALAPQLSALIAPGGIAAVEIGHTQASAVSGLFAAEGLATSVRRDLGGRDRAVILQHP